MPTIEAIPILLHSSRINTEWSGQRKSNCRAEIRKEKQVNFLLCLLPVNFAQQILQLDEIVGGRANRVRQRPEWGYFSHFLTPDTIAKRNEGEWETEDFEITFIISPAPAYHLVSSSQRFPSAFGCLKALAWFVNAKQADSWNFNLSSTALEFW